MIHGNPRINAISYLRRLQNDMLRFIPQLGRAIQMLQDGRVTHLPDFIDIFESLSASNAGAVSLIRTLNEQYPQHQPHQHVHGPQCNHPHPHTHPQQPPQQNTQMDVEAPEITATIVISDDQNGGQINVGINQQPQGPPFQSTILDTLSTFLQPGTGSGFNFANLFAQPPQPPQPPQRPNSPIADPQQQQQPNAQSSQLQNSQPPNSQPQQVRQQQPQPQQ